MPAVPAVAKALHPTSLDQSNSSLARSYCHLGHFQVWGFDEGLAVGLVRVNVTVVSIPPPPPRLFCPGVSWGRVWVEGGNNELLAVSGAVVIVVVVVVAVAVVVVVVVVVVVIV